MESILDSIKRLLGTAEDDTYYDPEIIMYINAVLNILLQLGVGPTTGFFIKGSEETWSEFLGESSDLEVVKVYTYLKVKEMFDPSLSSSVLDAMHRQVSELEWRLTAMAEGENQNGGNE